MSTMCTQCQVQHAPREAAGVPERPEDREEANKVKKQQLGNESA